MQASSLIEWPKPFFELLEFVGAFLAAGPVGFRYAALRGRMGAGVAHSPAYRRMAGRAAAIGTIGAAIGVWHVWDIAPRIAARNHVTVAQLLTSVDVTSAWFALAVLALVGFALATAGIAAGWPLAAIGIVVGSLRYLFVGDWGRLVTPVHLLAGGLWIGTLFVLMAAGLSVAFSELVPRESRGAVVADLVNGFSPLALVCGGFVVLFGALAAWRELHGSIDALWTTPYGYTLLTKLAFVAVVFALGAWNWRRQRPQLGSEGGALSIRRSARAELLVAALVLLITSVMTSLPAPDEGRPRGPAGPPAAGAAPQAR